MARTVKQQGRVWKDGTRTFPGRVPADLALGDAYESKNDQAQTERQRVIRKETHGETTVTYALQEVTAE